MADRPIIMDGESVRAILDGRKTQTRRIYKPRAPAPYEIIDELDDGRPWPFVMDDGGQYHARVCLYGKPGDRLWVKESFQILHVSIDPETGYGDDVWPAERITKDDAGGYWSVDFRATSSEAEYTTEDRGFAWRSPLYMPRWASRVTLEVTDVRFQRLHDISEDDAQAEGVEMIGDVGCPCEGEDDDPGPHIKGCSWSHIDVDPDNDPYRAAFAVRWDAINGKRAPWSNNDWVWAVSFRRTDDG